MSDVTLLRHLGARIADVLATKPFLGWEVTRSIEEDLAEIEIRYEFNGRGVEIICDPDDRVASLFLHRGGAEGLAEIPFSCSRAEVRRRFGDPERSGERSRSPHLGEAGAWDRFALGAGVLYFQYRLDSDEIELITLMRRDVAP